MTPDPEDDDDDDDADEDEIKRAFEEMMGSKSTHAKRGGKAHHDDDEKAYPDKDKAHK